MHIALYTIVYTVAVQKCRHFAPAEREIGGRAKDLGAFLVTLALRRKLVLEQSVDESAGKEEKKKNITLLIDYNFPLL